MNQTEKAMELEERIIRVEEELKSQRELMMRGFEAMDKRFNDLIHQMDKRFDQVDKRFEDLFHYMDKRFEQVERRFEQVDKRFEQIERLFEQVDKRFESMDKKIENLSKGLRTFAYSSFSFTAAAAGVIIAVLKLT